MKGILGLIDQIGVNHFDVGGTQFVVEPAHSLANPCPPPQTITTS